MAPRIASSRSGASSMAPVAASTWSPMKRSGLYPLRGLGNPLLVTDFSFRSALPDVSPGPVPVSAHRPVRHPGHGADLSTAMELVGWTNDRLVAKRLARLPQQEWVYGRPNASIVMASFLHINPTGMRFNSADLGAWYAAREIGTAAAEVAHHLRREAVARNVPG